MNRFDAEETLKEHNLPPLQLDKMLEEPELQAKIEELLEAVDTTEEAEEQDKDDK